MRLEWEDLEPVAESALHIWVDRPELGWASESWDRLSALGLADYETEAERAKVFARFIAMACFYRDWCAIAHDERYDDEDLDSWVEDAELEAVHVGQALGPKAQVENLSDALQQLMLGERDTVVSALHRVYEGRDGLFVSLWRSSQPAAAKFDLDRELEDEEDEAPESDWEILNNLDDDKLAAYNWLAAGCEYLGPERIDR
jgi:hypothetical protein